MQFKSLAALSLASLAAALPQIAPVEQSAPANISTVPVSTVIAPTGTVTLTETQCNIQYAPSGFTAVTNVKTKTVTKQMKVTSTSFTTVTPVTTVTPHYISTLDYTVSKSTTVTTTMTIVPSTVTVAPSAGQLPIDSTEQTPDKRKRQDTPSFSNSTAATTIADGFLTVTGGSVALVPTAAACTVSLATYVYTTVTKTAKTATVTAVPVATKSKSLAVATTTPTSTVTKTIIAPTPTYYAACDASAGWIVNEVDGYPIEAFANVGGVTHQVNASCPYECCAACQQDSSCLFSFYDLNYGTCNYVAGNYTYPIAWYVGSETAAYDSLAMSGGPAGDMQYCGFVPGCEMVAGKLVCPESSVP